MKKPFLLLCFVLFVLLSKTASAQVVDTPIEHDIGIHDPKPKVFNSVLLTGRVIGVNLENVPGVSVKNIRTSEKVSTDSRGIYQVNAIKSDTLVFYIAKYSKDTMIVKSLKDNLNLIMFKRKVDELPADYSSSDFNKAKREDNELYRVLEKDARLEEKWKY
jgi:hypothetical protein